MRAWFWGLRDERGSHLPELAMAMLVLSVVLIGTAGTLASSLTYVGGARQRSAGSALATEQLERIHTFPYDRISLIDDDSHPKPQHVPDDPNHPNHAVVAEPEDPCESGAEHGYYQLEDGGCPERLLLGGSVPHVEDPVFIGNTEFFIHQYVTDPSGDESFKRVTVVVTWKFPVNSGPSNRVVHSTFISPGTVTIEPEPTPTPGATPTPTPEPEPEPFVPTELPDGLCESDAEFGPPSGSMELMSGSGPPQNFHSSGNVQLRFEISSDCPTLVVELITTNVSEDWVEVFCHRDVPQSEDNCVDIRERDDFGNVVSPRALDPVTLTWAIPSEDGTYQISARYRDGNNRATEVGTESIIIDSAPPQWDPLPPTFTANCTIDGSDRIVVFSWTQATDANLLGYRLYRSIGSEGFEVVRTTGTEALSATDVHKKVANSVRFLVRAYDSAGNESEDSDVIAFSRNTCAH